jgi:hypothetical protein
MRFTALTLAFLFSVASRAEDLSKADRYFLQHGLAVHALCFPDQALHLKTLHDCGFTGVTWPGKSNMSQLGPPPGVPWCKWMTGDELALTPAEQPYAQNLIALQLRDEQNLNDDKTLAAAKKWFDEARHRFPNVILYTNQYGGLLTDPNMGRYIETCHPDMLSFDTYPIWETEDNWRSYFGDLQRYRAFSNGAHIPFACWMQTFHGENKYRDPSESELRLDVFGAWTFGAKMQTCFTYNAGSSSLFKKGAGDGNPLPAYDQLRQILRETHNLSPYLSKLRCTDARWVLGKNSQYPWGVEPWKYDKSFPQLRGITVKNAGKVHNGEVGDVALGFFRPLEGGENERWIMVTNALADRAANAEQCRQVVTLNVVLDAGESLEAVNRSTGRLEPAPLKRVGEAGRGLLELDLPGGTGELLCLRTVAASHRNHP